MKVERFGSLDRRAFASVLQKHLDGLPFWSSNGHTQEELRRSAALDVTSWLYSPNGTDRGQVEITFANSATPIVRHRRDFITGGLVDRAVQQAASAACLSASHDGERVGLTAELLMEVFDEQVRNIVERLDARNIGDYLDLPDGVRVMNVRRIRPASSHLSASLQRAS